MSESDSSQGAGSAAGSGASEGSAGVRGVLPLAERVYRKLAVDEAQPLPVRDHRSAVDSLRLLYEELAERPTADVEVRLLLLGLTVALPLHCSVAPGAASRRRKKVALHEMGGSNHDST